MDVDGGRRQPLQRLGQQHVAIELPAGEPEGQAGLLLAAGEGPEPAAHHFPHLAGAPQGEHQHGAPEGRDIQAEEDRQPEEEEVEPDQHGYHPKQLQIHPQHSPGQPSPLLGQHAVSEATQGGEQDGEQGDGEGLTRTHRQ
ncbi:hypothetical protein D3C73_1025510 [compost metagenome]